MYVVMKMKMLTQVYKHGKHGMAWMDGWISSWTPYNHNHNLDRIEWNIQQITDKSSFILFSSHNSMLDK